MDRSRGILLRAVLKVAFILLDNVHIDVLWTFISLSFRPSCKIFDAFLIYRTGLVVSNFRQHLRNQCMLQTLCFPTHLGSFRDIVARMVSEPFLLPLPSRFTYCC